MPKEKKSEEILNQFKEILNKPTQEHLKDELLDKHREFYKQGGKKPDWENEHLASNLEDFIDRISMITEEWQKDEGGSPEEDVLGEIEGIRENVERDEAVRVLELPLLRQLLSIIDEIPLEKIDEVLELLDEDNIIYWDDRRAKELAVEIRTRLRNKKDNLL